MLAATPIRCPRSSLEGALTTEDARKRGEVAGASAQQQRGLGRTHAEAPHLRPVCVCHRVGGEPGVQASDCKVQAGAWDEQLCRLSSCRM